MTAERTALESALIPVTAYILISGIECYRRYPELMAAIAAAMPPEEIGAARPAAGQPGRRGAPLVDRQHRARRPPDPGAVRDDRSRRTTSRRSPRSSASGSPPPRAFRGRRAPAGVGRGLRRPALRTGRDRRARRRHDPDRRRRGTRHALEAQRRAHVVPLPPLLRHPRRLPGHRARTRCPTAARCSSATSTRWRSRTSPGARRSAPTCRTRTSPSRSCSTAWT